MKTDNGNIFVVKSTLSAWNCNFIAIVRCINLDAVTIFVTNFAPNSLSLSGCDCHFNRAVMNDEIQGLGRLFERKSFWLLKILHAFAVAEHNYTMIEDVICYASA